MKKEREVAGIFVASLFLVALALSFLVVPASTGSSLKPHDPIIIDSRDDWLNPENGIAEGDGTEENPFIIEGWCIDTTDSDTGILISDVDEFAIIRNVAIQNAKTGIAVDDPNLKVMNSHLSNNKIGIECSGRGCSVLNNVFSENTYGIKCEVYACPAVAPLVVSQNKFINCDKALFLLLKSNRLEVNVTNNIVSNSKCGIYIDFCLGPYLIESDISISHNLIMKNDNGIEIQIKHTTGYYFEEAPFRCNIRFNEITRNKKGLYISVDEQYENLVKIKINRNNIFENENGAVFSGVYDNENISAEENWWGHETGPSGDGDGWGNPISFMKYYKPWLGIKEQNAGLESELGISEVDAESPKVEIISPKRESTVDQDHFCVWFKVTDNVGLSYVKIFFDDQLEEDKDLHGRKNYEYAKFWYIKLTRWEMEWSSGDTTLKIIVYDTWGNKDEESVHFKHSKSSCNHGVIPDYLKDDTNSDDYSDNGGVTDNDDDYDDDTSIPGFELVLLIASIAIVLLWKRKRK